MLFYFFNILHTKAKKSLLSYIPRPALISNNLLKAGFSSVNLFEYSLKNLSIKKSIDSSSFFVHYII